MGTSRLKQIDPILADRGTLRRIRRPARPKTRLGQLQVHRRSTGRQPPDAASWLRVRVDSAADAIRCVPIEMNLWRIQDDRPVPVAAAGNDEERRLESVIVMTWQSTGSDLFSCLDARS
jgi:hypothetical protein